MPGDLPPKAFILGEGRASLSKTRKGKIKKQVPVDSKQMTSLIIIIIIG
jgi:hypothetical protein